MELELGLVAAREDGIFYVLFVDGVKLCDAMTHSYTDPDGSLVSKTPNGQYECKRGLHKLHNGLPFETFEVMGVPGHSGILFHKGNFNRDSEGCFLLGTQTTGITNGVRAWGVMNSAAAFEKFMRELEGRDTVSLRIADD